MKIDQVYGDNKERDLNILNDYIDETQEVKDIALKYNLSVVRIHQIAYANHTLIKLNAEKEKLTRVMWLKRQHFKRGDSKKDSADLAEQIRKEIEGDKPLIDQSVHNNTVTYVWENSTDQIQPSRIPTSVSE